MKKIPLTQTVSTQRVHIDVLCKKGLATIELVEFGNPDQHGGKKYECIVRFHPFKKCIKPWYRIKFEGLVSFRDSDPGISLPKTSMWQLSTISMEQLMAAAMVGYGATLLIEKDCAIITCPVIKNGTVRAELPKALRKILFG